MKADEDKMKLFQSGLAFVQVATTGDPIDESYVVMVGSGEQVSGLLLRALCDLYLQAADGSTIEDYADSVATGIKIVLGGMKE